MIKTEQFQKVEVVSREELRSWLIEHHSQTESVWLVTYKKSEASKYISRWDVLDELLCFGWIDGIRRKLDEQRTMQLIAPRKAEHWAKSYKDRVAKLTEQGLMHAAGLKSVEAAKASGSWTFMDDVDNLIVPDDLKNALYENKEALSFFDSINPSSKRFVLRWLKLAKTEKTRISRIEKLVNLSAQGKKLPGS